MYDVNAQDNQDNRMKYIIYENVSQYDQEICRPTHGTMKKRHRTLTTIQQQGHNKSI